MNPDKNIEFKRDALVIVPYTLFVLIAVLGVATDKITWPQFLAVMGALNVPSIFGLKKRFSDDDRKTPPMPPPPSPGPGEPPSSPMQP